MSNVIRVEQNGHEYRVVPIADEAGWYTVTKDGGRTKRINQDELFLNGDLIDIEVWFDIAK